ncbi:YfjL-like protein [Natronincola ferrireducens]|uniref:Uncharacterized protein n=1 Tax=Natronincola ferrireducens TaxID=393762 RepID=A0A1G9GH51_9FIRM|nr:hypothetical protein [Natronincola ferrireducens]SDL00000.1 hypothetical protein SAMN05660472_02419 [Natronincola ferrireducens]
MNKATKILAGITAVMLIIMLLYFANGLLGNPVSKLLAERSVPKYIAETYPDMDLVVDGINYNFKTGGYSAYIKSPTSIDTHFYLEVSLIGKVISNSYEDGVLSGWNTGNRISSEYRTMVNKIFDDPDFPYSSEIGFGDIPIVKGDVEIGYPEPNYGILLGELELDKIYDIKELAKSGGHVVFYAQSEEVSVEMASEILIDLKKFFQQAEVPFYAIDFYLEKPRSDDGLPNQDTTRIGVNNFLYSDIYEEDMEERLSIAVKKLQDYYAKEDAKMK